MNTHQEKIFDFEKEEVLEILRDHIIKNTKEEFDICQDQSTELVAVDTSAGSRSEIYFELLCVEIKA